MIINPGYETTGSLEHLSRAFHSAYKIVFLGRWISRDPIGEQGGLNLYDYCLNKPAIDSDDLGLCCVCDIELISSGPMKGGKNIHDYYPSLAHNYGPSDPTQTGPFSNSGGIGAVVQIIGKSTGPGKCGFSQKYVRDGSKIQHDDIKESGNDSTSQPFRQDIPSVGPSFADIPGAMGGLSVDPTTFTSCIYSSDASCSFKKCCIKWHEDSHGRIKVIGKSCGG